MKSRNGLEVSETPRIRLVDDPAHPKLKAFASVVLNGEFRIHCIRVVQVGDRLIVSFPSRQTPGGDHYDVVHPLDDATRRWVERPILEAYCRELAYAREWAERTRPALYDEPPASSCGHPTEEAFFEKFDYQAAC